MKIKIFLAITSFLVAMSARAEWAEHDLQARWCGGNGFEDCHPGSTSFQHRHAHDDSHRSRHKRHHRRNHRRNIPICHVGRDGVHLIKVSRAKLRRHTSHGDSPPRTWFPDDDGDGFGTAEGAIQACEAPLGFVDNSDDNCPAISNEEQFDSDADGKGDTCDVVIVNAATVPGPALRHTASTAQPMSEFALGSIKNNSDLPQTWSLTQDLSREPFVGTQALPPNFLMLEIDSGVLQPGESVALRAILMNLDNLEPGRYYTAFSISVDGDNPISEIVWFIIGRLFPSDCDYRIVLAQVCVDDLENEPDDVAEIKPAAVTANGDATSWSGKVPDGACTDPDGDDGLPKEITNLTVRRGSTVGVRVSASVVEEDLQFNDTGSDEDVLLVSCDTSGTGQPSSVTLSFGIFDSNPLFFANTGQDGTVDVTIAAQPIQ